MILPSNCTEITGTTLHVTGLIGVECSGCMTARVLSFGTFGRRLATGCRSKAARALSVRSGRREPTIDRLRFVHSLQSSAVTVELIRSGVKSSCTQKSNELRTNAEKIASKHERSTNEQRTNREKFPLRSKGEARKKAFEQQVSSKDVQRKNRKKTNFCEYGIALSEDGFLQKGGNHT